MKYEHLHYDVSERIATIRLDRPEVLNAVSHQTLDELHHALSAADDDDEVRAVIITGTGRAFCSGTDLSKSTWAGREGDPATGEGVPADIAAAVPLRLYDMNKPVIGALNGVAAGFGASMLCAMDVRLAANDARVNFVYAKRGICNESCSSFFLPRVVGISRAVEWVSTARMVGADELMESGFVRALVPVSQLARKARELAAEIALNTSPAAVAVSRRLMWNMLSAQHPREATALETRGLTGLMNLPDPREGTAAFREKRPPNFTTRPSQDIGFVKHWWPTPGQPTAD